MLWTRTCTGNPQSNVSTLITTLLFAKYFKNEVCSPNNYPQRRM